MLNELSKELTALAEKLSPFVVSVENEAGEKASGFIINPQGHAAVSSHSFSSERGLKVQFYDNHVSEAELLGFDNSLDLAFLSTGVKGDEPPLEYDPQLSPGELVLMLGRSPSSLLLHWGMISETSSAWKTPMGGEVDNFWEVDGSLHSLSSGGPLLNAQGRIVGMNSHHPHSSGMTVPVKNLMLSYEKILKHGRIKRPYYGIHVMPVETPKGIPGLMILAVENNSPAEKAGLFMGDTLLKLNRKSVSDVSDLLHSPGSGEDKKVSVEIFRAGQIVKLDVVPDYR